MHRDHKVILTAFAGRRDRMALFLAHADRLVAAGLVDEVHLWDYCRARDDRAWLRALPSSILCTSGYDYSAPEPVGAATSDAGSYAFRVYKAASDVAVLLTTPDGTEYELVLGGWNNTGSVFRRGRQGTDIAFTDTVRLATDGWTDVTLSWGEAGSGTLHVRVGGVDWTVPFAGPVATVRHASWEGTAAYDVPPAPTTRYRLGLPAASSKWHSYYTHYNALVDSVYANTILIKSDDDIVHMGSETAFRAFLDFRIDHPQYALVFPNIVNNGVTAYFQKQHGLLGDIDLEDSIPETCGRLWESGHRARLAHEAYLANPASFAYEGHEEVAPRQRMGINFFAVLPATVGSALFGEAGEEDEAALTESADAGPKAIFNGFPVAHLSFYSQERSIGSAELLMKYETLTSCGSPGEDPVAVAAAVETVPKRKAPVRRPRLLKPVAPPPPSEDDVTPSEAAVPGEAAVPVETAVPGENAEPVETVVPVEPVETAEPTEPVETAGPPVKPVEPTGPTGPPVEPEVPATAPVKPAVTPPKRRSRATTKKTVDLA